MTRGSRCLAGSALIAAALAFGACGEKKEEIAPAPTATEPTTTAPTQTQGTATQPTTTQTGTASNQGQ